MRRTEWPKPERGGDAVSSVLQTAIIEGRVGADLEYTLEGPTIIGIASLNRCAAAPWSRELGFALANCGVPIAAHAGIGADKPVLEKALGIVTPLEQWNDTMVKHWIVNPDLASVPKSLIAEDSDDPGIVFAFMNLWAATSFQHDIPNWKECIGKDECLAQQRPCPEHDPYGYCLRGESLVYLADGTTARINDLVEHKTRAQVLCVTPDGQLTSRPIKNWFANLRNGREFLKIAYEGMTGGQKGVVLTEDHKVLTRRGYVAARDLVRADQINTGTIDFTKRQKQVLAGILLGDSHNDSGKIILTHGTKQYEYLDLKKKLFENWVLSDDEYVSQGKFKHRNVKFEVRPASKVLPKNTSDTWLSWVSSNLTLPGIAVWYMDDGSFHKGQMSISVKSYSQAERLVLAHILNRELGLKSHVSETQGSIVWNAAEAKIFSEMISSFVPPPLRYKLHPEANLTKFDVNFWQAPASEELETFWSEVVVLPETPRKNWRNGNPIDNTVYCIEVEEFNNFLTSGGIVHNCAVDSWAGLVNDYNLDEDFVRLGIPQSYYAWRRELTEYCERISDKGVRVDLDVIAGLEAAIASRKATLFPARMVERTKVLKNGKVKVFKPKKVWDGPFNPNSPLAVLKWFHEHGISLVDRGGKPSMGKQIVLHALSKQLKPYGLEFDPRIGELKDNDFEGELPEAVDMLLRLAQKTVAGKGLKSWFSSEHIQNGEAHPRFISTGTSTSRLSSSRPNFQNIPRVGFGAEVRRAIIARPGFKIVKADYSQLEFRVCLWAAGLDPNLADGAFELLTERSGGQFQAAADRLSWKPRDVAKSVVHGGDYLEGIQIKTASELSADRAVGDRRAGALLVYDGKDHPAWEFRGGYVCFTGGNLAERLFGDRTRDSRAKALKIQQVYLDVFPQIREFQQKVSKEIELSHEVRLPSGHRVALYGRTPEDDLKFATSVWGQGGGAIYAQEGMLNFARQGDVMIMQVHDEYVWEVPEDWTDDQILDFMRPMVKPSSILPGFVSPAKVSVSNTTPANWKQTREIGTIR